MSFPEFLASVLSAVSSRGLLGTLVVLASWAFLVWVLAYGGFKLADLGHGKWNWLFMPGAFVVSVIGCMFGIWLASYA